MLFCREKREEEIEYFMMKKYNKLGGKILTKTTQLNTLVTDSKLVLKWNLNQTIYVEKYWNFVQFLNGYWGQIGWAYSKISLVLSWF